MNYIAKIQDRLQELAAQRGHSVDDSLAGFYALLVLTTGEATTLENVHDAWSAWRNLTRPDHKSLIWFDQLTKEIQDYDEPYRALIADVAEEVRVGQFAR